MIFKIFSETGLYIYSCSQTHPPFSVWIWPKASHMAGRKECLFLFRLAGNDFRIKKGWALVFERWTGCHSKWCQVQK